MRSNTLRHVLVICGYAANADKMSDPKLVTEVIESFSKRLGMSRNMLNLFCIKMTHPDPGRSFIAGGIVAHSGTVLLDTFPGKMYLKLRIFSSRGLKGFLKTAEKVVRDTFGLTRYEMDIQKLENLQH